jgi:hypothetical protein
MPFSIGIARGTIRTTDGATLTTISSRTCRSNCVTTIAHTRLERVVPNVADLKRQSAISVRRQVVDLPRIEKFC